MYTRELMSCCRRGQYSRLQADEIPMMMLVVIALHVPIVIFPLLRDFVSDSLIGGRVASCHMLDAYNVMVSWIAYIKGGFQQSSPGEGSVLHQAGMVRRVWVGAGAHLLHIPTKQ